MNATQALLQVNQVTKRFGKTVAVDNVSLDVNSAEIICLLGPSGCGKTTLLRLIAGLEVPDSGQITFDNTPITNTPIHQRSFGMMFQSFALFPHMNVFENVAYGLRRAKHSPSSINQRVAEMLQLVDLTGYDQRSTDQLSGGQQQRVALARALATEPRLLMLDEPLGSLDQSLREKLMIELRDIIQRVGVTALYVTHDQSEAYAVADWVAVMNGGQIEQVDTPEALFGKPQSAFVADFLGLTNLVKGEIVSDQMVETMAGPLYVDKIDSPDQKGSVDVLIRPNALSATKTVNAISADLTSITFRGRYFELSFNSPLGTLQFEVADPSRWKTSPTNTIYLDQAHIQILNRTSPGK